MKAFAKKTLANILAVFCIVTCSFFLIFFIPGDPVDYILRESASAEDKNFLRREMGLDKPLPARYAGFIKDLLQLNLGKSVHTGEPVLQSIAHHFPFTFFLSLLSLCMAFFWGLSGGVLSAYPSLKKFEKFFDIFPLIFFSIPVFVSAPLLIWLFGVRLGWFPISGDGSFSYLFLPALSLALPLGAVLMKVTRASVLEVLSSDFVRTAQAKGLPPWRIYFYHVLKNAWIPIITILGLQWGALLTGAVIVETVFDRPGIGSLLYNAVVSRDYPLIQALILLIALIYVFVNRWTDWLYSTLHPLMKSH